MDNIMYTVSLGSRITEFKCEPIPYENKLGLKNYFIIRCPHCKGDGKYCMVCHKKPFVRPMHPTKHNHFEL